MDSAKQPGLKITQVFLELARFGHSKDYLRFPPSTPVKLEIELTLTSGVTPDHTKGRVQLQARSKPSPDALYEFDVVMTALVEREGDENFPLERYVTVNGPALVFPFLREAVANMTARGRFGPVWLSPVNFVALSAEGANAGAPTAAAPRVSRSRGEAGQTK